MVISLTPGNNTSPTITLPHSGVTLTPKPLTDAQKEALKNAAANTPAVIYHPSTEVPATTEPMEVIETWIAVLSRLNSRRWRRSTGRRRRR